MQTTAKRRRFSQLRTLLLTAADEIARLIEPFLKDTPILAGAVYEQRRKCGKPNCKCAAGELHGQMVLSTKDGGKTKLHTIPKGALVETRLKAERYRALRRARARLNALHQEMLHDMDEMEAMRRDEVS